VNRSFNSTRWI